MEDDELIPPAELAQLASALACAICKDVLDGPVSAPCGHIFCSGCIRGYLDHNQKQNQSQMCPSCRKPCAPNDLRRLDAVRMAVEALPAAIAAVHDLKRRCEDAELRAAAAEQQVAQLMASRAHSAATANNTHAAAATAINAAIAANIPSSSLHPAVSEHSLGTGASGRRGAGDGNNGGTVDDGQASPTPGPAPQSRLVGKRAGKRTRRDTDLASGDRISLRSTPPHDLRGGGGAAAAADEGKVRDGPWAGDNDSEDGSEHGDDTGDLDYSPGSPSPGSNDRASGRAGRRRRGQLQHLRGGGGRQGAGQRAKRARLGGGEPPNTTTTTSTTPDVPDGQGSTGVAAAAGEGASRPARHDGGGGRVAAAGWSGITPAPAAAPDAPSDGLGECPLCACRYPLLQLQAHVEMCLTRKGMLGAGRGPVAAAAAAATAPAVPLPHGDVVGRRGRATPAVGAGPEAGLAAAAAAAAQPPLRLGAVGVGSVGPEVREPTDIRIPAARNWHQMKDKEARKVMTDCGLPAFGQKQEMAERYNRYRSFLQTERDKCTTETMDQLLRAFIKRERQADAGRRQPAIAPAWMQVQIKSAAEQMKAQQQQHRRLPRRAPDLDSAEGDHDNPAVPPNLGQAQTGAPGAANPAAAAASEPGPEDGKQPVAVPDVPFFPPDERTSVAATAADAAAKIAAAAAAGDAAARDPMDACPGAGAASTPASGAYGDVARVSGGGLGPAAGAGPAATAARSLPPTADVITIDDSDDGEDQGQAAEAAGQPAEDAGVHVLGLGMDGTDSTAGAMGRRLEDRSSSLPPGSFPPGSFPPGSFPPGSFPPGSFPPGSFPPGSFPPGPIPPGSFPRGSFPPGSFPPGSFPPGSFPPGSFPPGSFPPGPIPPGSFPPGSLLPGSLLPGPIPPGSLPPGSLLPGPIPPGSFPPGSFPPGSFPPGSLLPGPIPPGSFPPGSFPPGSLLPGPIPPGSFPPGPIPPGSRAGSALGQLSGILGLGNEPPAAPPDAAAADGSDTGRRQRASEEEQCPVLRTPRGVCPAAQRNQLARLAGHGVGGGGGGGLSGDPTADGGPAGCDPGEVLRSDSGESSDEEAAAGAGAGCSGAPASAFHGGRGGGGGAGHGGGVGADCGSLGQIPLVQCLAEAGAYELPYTANGLRTTPLHLAPSGLGSESGSGRGLGSGSGPRTAAPCVRRSDPDSGGGEGSAVRGGMLRAQPQTAAAGAAAEGLTDISNGNGSAVPRPSPLTTPAVKASLFL